LTNEAKMMNRILVFLLSLVICPGFAALPDGLWKAVYSSTSSEDTLLQYTKMLLRIEGEAFQLVNYDSYLVEKNFFKNEGLFQSSDSSLVFNSDSINQKKFKINIIDDSHLVIITRENPRTEIAFTKMKKYELGGAKDELEESLLINTFEFNFTFFEEKFEMEFYGGNRFMVTNNVEPFFPEFSKWAVVEFDSELFIYFSGFSPFLHVISMDAEGISCEDEFGEIYKAFFKRIEFQQKFNREQLLGIWEEKSVNTDYLKSMPENLWEKDVYPRKVWEINEESATLYSVFRTLDSPMEISRSGEMLKFLMFNEINNHQLRILSLDKDNLVVERLDIYGEVCTDTLVKQKKVPAPVTLKDFFKE